MRGALGSPRRQRMLLLSLLLPSSPPSRAVAPAPAPGRLPCGENGEEWEKCETHEVSDAVSANLYTGTNTRNLGGAPYETTFLVPSRTKMMRQGVPRVASLDAVQLRCAVEHKGYTGFRVYNKTGDGDTRRKILT